MNKLKDYDYSLPEELIAVSPIEPRDHCRLLVHQKEKKRVSHHTFYEILDFLNPGDLLVLNDSKVFPARLIGANIDTGGKAEVLLDHEIEPGIWKVIGKGLKEGRTIDFGGMLKGTVTKREDKISYIDFGVERDVLLSRLDKVGKVPLPPYIEAARKKRKCNKTDDLSNYQTTYAENAGSVAAPTAGLHFTKDLIDKIREKGIEVHYLTLHVGLGTFAPIEVDEISEHKIHSEHFSINCNTVQAIKRAKNRGARVIAVGTTTTRVLEHISSLDLANEDRSITGWTDIFIYPPYRFKLVDGMITNFHLPKSSLLMLVAAFTSLEEVKRIYREAIKKRYRFYSYGDTMLII